MSMVLLCRAMQWDYYTFMRQPQWFIDLLRMANNLDAEYQSKLLKQQHRKSGR